MNQQAGTANILAQLYRAHKIYGQRLAVLRRTLHDIGDTRAYRLAEHVKTISFHNEQCERRLSDGRGGSKGSSSSGSGNGNDGGELFGGAWAAEHTQQVYEPLIMVMLSDPALLCDILARPDIHRITEGHNRDVFGNDKRNYFDVETFPAFMIDHLLHTRKILDALNKRNVDTLSASNFVTQLIVWLDEQLQDFFS